VLSQGGPRDAAVNLGIYRSLQRHRAVFYCDSNAFGLNNSVNHGKITVLFIAFKFIICLTLSATVKLVKLLLKKNCGGGTQ